MNENDEKFYVDCFFYGFYMKKSEIKKYQDSLKPENMKKIMNDKYQNTNNNKFKKVTSIYKDLYKNIQNADYNTNSIDLKNNLDSDIKKTIIKTKKIKKSWCNKLNCNVLHQFNSYNFNIIYNLILLKKIISLYKNN